MNERRNMRYAINDYTLIDEITKELGPQAQSKAAGDSFKEYDFSYPLDQDVICLMQKIMPQNESSPIDCTRVDELDDLWRILIRKSIECLRYFDKREPFMKSSSNKSVVAYGLENLTQYHNRYTKFEGMLYGASPFYRDHVFHVIRTWMLGIFCLTKLMDDKMFIDEMLIDGESKPKFSNDINYFEKISMWTIIALCHDLGYPLEKSEQILNKTQEMMKDFIPRPSVWNNFGFSGTQDTINEYILKFISTKMKPAKETNWSKPSDEAKASQGYHGRIQPKYYLKFAKSLEGFNHGVISAVIVYKMLLYFLESDFNLNDDYLYEDEDARQFYIRREMLRAMSAHTCPDVYNIHLSTFSTLLFLCDELQEWGRKSWNDLYAGLNSNAIDLTIIKFSTTELNVEEVVEMKDIESKSIAVKNIGRIHERQYSLYKTTFRDGQYTKERDLCIKKQMKIILPPEKSAENVIFVRFELSKLESRFKVDLTGAPTFNNEGMMKEIRDCISKSLYREDLDFA